jgi:hypothetical protein
MAKMDAQHYRVTAKYRTRKSVTDGAGVWFMAIRPAEFRGVAEKAEK